MEIFIVGAKDKTCFDSHLEKMHPPYSPGEKWVVYDPGINTL